MEWVRISPCLKKRQERWITGIPEVPMKARFSIFLAGCSSGLGSEPAPSASLYFSSLQDIFFRALTCCPPSSAIMRRSSFLACFVLRLRLIDESLQAFDHFLTLALSNRPACAIVPHRLKIFPLQSSSTVPRKDLPFSS